MSFTAPFGALYRAVHYRLSFLVDRFLTALPSAGDHEDDAVPPPDLELGDAPLPDAPTPGFIARGESK